MALDRAASDDPSYEMARIIRLAVSNAIPSSMPDLAVVLRQFTKGQPK